MIDWIKFSERKPKEGDDVLISDYKGDVFRIQKFNPEMSENISSEFRHWTP